MHNYTIIKRDFSVSSQGYKYNVNWLTTKLPIIKDINSSINKFNLPLTPNNNYLHQILLQISISIISFFKHPPIITSISSSFAV